MKAIRVFFILGIISFCASASFAEEVLVPPAAEASAEEQAMMEKMKTMTAPGEAHKVLETLAGSWSYTAKMWMPDGKSEETTGRNIQTLVYGGRFLKQDVQGTWMGQPFEGTGCIGYDNVKQEYVSVWVDSMSTGIMTESGQYDPAAKTFTFNGSNSCPMTGEKDHKSRSELKIIDENNNVYTVYTNGPDGKEMKAMELTYTRLV